MEFFAFVFVASLCASLAASSPAPPCPSDNFAQVYYPDSDCTKYWQCSNGKAQEFVCPGTLNWSPTAKTCDWPETAGCNGHGWLSTSTSASTTTTTTPAPTTTSTTTTTTTTPAPTTTTTTTTPAPTTTSTTTTTTTTPAPTTTTTTTTTPAPTTTSTTTTTTTPAPPAPGPGCWYYWIWYPWCPWSQK